MSVQPMVLGRAKRSNAGNRMRELLEKAHALEEEEGFEEVPDDIEFEKPAEEEDVFAEDFSSTDDERDTEMDEVTAERLLEKEEKRARKAERQKGRHYHNPITAGNAKPAAATGVPRPPHKRPRVSIQLPSEGADSPVAGSSRDGESGTPGDEDEAVRAERMRRRQEKELRREGRRSTMRASTLKNKEDIDIRLKEEKAKYAHHGRPKAHLHIPRMTQGDLIAAALQTEEENLESLRVWLAQEEERKRLNKVVRKVVAGPRTTWVSRRVDIEDKGAARAAKEAARRDRKGKGKEVIPIDPPSGAATQLAEPTSDGTPLDSQSVPMTRNASASSSTPSVTTTSQPALDSQPAYTRNYVILSSIPGGQAGELKALFGDHGDWTAMPRVTSRNRPINRRPTMCPFTGLPAKYRCPKTLVPYANVDAYKLIQATLDHSFLWSEDRNAYFGAVSGPEAEEKADGMEGIAGWDAACKGWWKGEVAEQAEMDVDMEVGGNGVAEIIGEIVVPLAKAGKSKPKGKGTKRKAA